MMRVTIIGSGTAIPTPERAYAGVYIEIAGEKILLDAGPGSLAKLARVGVTFLDLDRVYLTHLHPDHCADLISLLFAMHIPCPARRKAFTVYGPRGLAKLHRRLDAAFPGWLVPRSYRLAIREIAEGAWRNGGYRVRTRPMRHSTRAYGYRLEHGGKSLAYAADTDACPAVVELARGADVLLLECSMPDERKVKGHLTPSECGRLAAEAGCRRLVLTHFYPLFTGYDIRARVRRFYKGPLTIAKDFTAFTV